MGFNRLKFTKLWTRHADFPTVETDENQVRADMQLLHDEAKDGLNKLEEELEAGTAATSLGAKSPATGADSNVQTELEALYKAHTSAGGIPAAGLEGQVLAKTSEENYAASWQNVSDLVAHLKGKADWFAGLDSNGILAHVHVPGDLAKVSQYCWRRTATSVNWGIQEGGQQQVTLCGSSGDSSDCETTVSYGTKVAVSATGELSLSGTTGTVAVGYDSVSNGNSVLPGKYFKKDSSFFRVPSDASVYDNREWDGNNDEYDYRVYVSAVPISAVQVQPGSDHVCSANRSAYPDYGEQDGFHFEYSGVVLEKAMAAPRMACGTYVGTGKYGSANPCTVALDFTPLFFIAVDTDYYAANYLVIYAGYAPGSYLVFTKGE